MRFIWSLVFELKVDETVLILLLMMALFSSDRENLHEKEYIAAQQEKWVAGGGMRRCCCFCWFSIKLVGAVIVVVFEFGIIETFVAVVISFVAVADVYFIVSAAVDSVEVCYFYFT